MLIWFIDLLKEMQVYFNLAWYANKQFLCYLVNQPVY